MFVGLSAQAGGSEDALGTAEMLVIFEKLVFALVCLGL